MLSLPIAVFVLLLSQISDTISPLYNSLELNPRNYFPHIDAACVPEFNKRYTFINAPHQSGRYGVVFDVMLVNKTQEIDFPVSIHEMGLYNQFALKAVYSKTPRIPTDETHISFLINELIDLWKIPIPPHNQIVTQKGKERVWRYIGFVRTLDFFPCTDKIIPEPLRRRKTTTSRDATVRRESVNYLLMENLGRTTLAKRLEDCGWFIKNDDRDVSLDFIRGILIQILSSLWYAYEYFDFTHHDLHAGNIMLHFDRRYSRYTDWVFEFTVHRSDDSGSDNEDYFDRPEDELSDAEYEEEEFAVIQQFDWGNKARSTLSNSVRHDRGVFSSRRATTSSQGAGGGSGSLQHFSGVLTGGDSAEEYFNEQVDQAINDKIEPDLEDKYHNPLLRFIVPRKVTFGLNAKIIDFGYARAFDPRSRTVHGREFNPFKDLRLLAYSIITNLPIGKLRKIFCVAQYENFECLSEEVVQALQQEYNEFTEVLKGLLFAIPRRPKALRSDRLLLERLAEREQKIETDLNELIIQDLRACDVSNENVMLGKNWLKLDWLAAASFAFRCRLGPKRREKPKSLKFFENFLPGLTAKKMSSPTLRRQIRRTIIELLSHKFFRKYYDI